MPGATEREERLLVLAPLIVVGGAVVIGWVLSSNMPTVVAFSILLPVGLIVITAAVALVLLVARRRGARR